MRSGCSSIVGEPRGAAAAVVGQRERPDPVHPRERGLGQRQPDRGHEEHQDPDEQQPVGSAHGCHLRSSGRPRPARGLSEQLQQLAFSALHRLRLTLLGVVVVQQMQDPVHDEQRELVVERRRRARRLALRDRRADDHVAEHDRRVVGLGRRSRAPPAVVGPAPAGHEVVVDREREHVGRRRGRRGSGG